MIDELSPQARALLDGARGAMAPDAAAIARMRAKIDTTVIAGSTGGAIAGASVATKLSIVSVVAVVAAGALVYGLGRGPATPPAPRVVAKPTIAAPVAVVVAPVAPVAAPVAAAEIEMPAESAVAVDKPAPTKRARPATPTLTIDLAREVELVDRAHAALKRGDFPAALAAVELHQRETGGRGQLAEDAAAIEIESMCRSRRDVTVQLAAFDRRFPSSAQRARIAAACP